MLHCPQVASCFKLSAIVAAFHSRFTGDNSPSEVLNPNSSQFTLSSKISPSDVGHNLTKHHVKKNLTCIPPVLALILSLKVSNRIDDKAQWSPSSIEKALDKVPRMTKFLVQLYKDLIAHGNRPGTHTPRAARPGHLG